MTTNYGLAGGTLDASKHIEAALTRLLSGPEQDAYCKRACLLAEATTNKAKRDSAAQN
jgi:hypothetical protein